MGAPQPGQGSLTCGFPAPDPTLGDVVWGDERYLRRHAPLFGETESVVWGDSGALLEETRPVT